MPTVTLRHIAKAAKVSVGSVSRALTNDPMISPPTRQRVWEISQRMGYETRQRRTRDRFGYAPMHAPAPVRQPAHAAR